MASRVVHGHGEEGRLSTPHSSPVAAAPVAAPVCTVRTSTHQPYNCKATQSRHLEVIVTGCSASLQSGSKNFTANVRADQPCGFLVHLWPGQALAKFRCCCTAAATPEGLAYFRVITVRLHGGMTDSSCKHCARHASARSSVISSHKICSRNYYMLCGLCLAMSSGNTPRLSRQTAPSVLLERLPPFPVEIPLTPQQQSPGANINHAFDAKGCTENIRCPLVCATLDCTRAAPHFFFGP